MKKRSSIFDDFSDSEKAEIIRRIISIRTQKLHYSQAEFADLLQLSQPYVSALEAGKRPLTKSTLKKIVSTCNTSQDWILYGFERTPSEQSILDTEAFVDWFKSLPFEDQTTLAKLTRELYLVFISHPPII